MWEGQNWFQINKVKSTKKGKILSWQYKDKENKFFFSKSERILHLIPDFLGNGKKTL